MTKLKSCPFCGGEAYIAITDDEGNFHEYHKEEYLKNPYSGLRYALMHDADKYEDCPIANDKEDEQALGKWLYDTEKEAIEAWNRREGGLNE